MPRNVEIKARPVDITDCEQRARTLAGTAPSLIVQEDFFFHCGNGRLKLRVLSPARGQLIHYHRADTSSPSLSRYRIAETNTPDALLDTLATAYGVRGVVRKRRHLYRVGRTRVHIDRVETLGGFVELEVVLADGDSEPAARNEASTLMTKLGIDEGDLIETAYIDLIDAQTRDDAAVALR